MIDVEPRGTTNRAAASGVAEHFREHERFLRGLCYRMTGSAADAEDLVQDTFLRAMERPPARDGEPWRPWLVRVAMNLGRDALRRRKRRAYTGAWLPSPIETARDPSDASEPPSWEIAGEGGTEGRYDLLESVSFAFLLALEALTPQQRAVLLLRDVFDYSVKEAADALGLSEPNVKTTHHRARRALEPYDADRCRPTPELAARSYDALRRFVEGIARSDVAAVEALLAEDARALTDGGGEFLAALRPVEGRDHVARFCIGLAKRRPNNLRVAFRIVNGLPAILMEHTPESGRIAPRNVFRIDLDGRGLIHRVHSIVATAKLTAVAPIA